MQPYRPTKIDGLLQMQIECDQIVLVTCVTGANNWAHTMLSNILEANLAECHIGFDCEWNCDTCEVTRTLQLSFPASVSLTKATVLCLSKMGAISAETFPTGLKSLLELPTIVPVGVNVGVDIARISKFGVKFTRFKDLSAMAQNIDDSCLDGYGMKALCA